MRNTNFVGCVGEQKQPKAGFLHRVFNDRVKSAQRPVYFIALTGLS